MKNREVVWIVALVIVGMAFLSYVVSTQNTPIPAPNNTNNTSSQGILGGITSFFGGSSGGGSGSTTKECPTCHGTGTITDKEVVTAVIPCTNPNCVVGYVTTTEVRTDPNTGISHTIGSKGPCPVCHGNGNLGSHKITRDVTKTCPTCHGNKVFLLVDVKCPNCGGTGKVPA